LALRWNALCEASGRAEIRDWHWQGRQASGDLTSPTFPLSGAPGRSLHPR
jgi:hypothetical protein